MITLRTYQHEAVRQTHAALRRVNRAVLSAPTGSGKRVLAAWWAAEIAKRGRRLMVVTDRKILVNQMAAECEEHGIEYGIRMASEPRNADAPVQICSIQTMRARKWQDCPPADWVIIDEAHKDEAGYAKLLEQYNGVKVCGLTATPAGANGKRLANFDMVVEPVLNSELIKDGWLLPTELKCPFEPDIKGVDITSSTGEFNQTQLGERMTKCVIFADVFKWWKPVSHLPTIVFSPGVAFAYGICEEFEKRGRAAAVIEANTSTKERERILSAFESNRLVLVSVMVLAEGFDAPEASVGIDLQTNNQLRGWWQKLGRVKRPHEGIEQCHWLDFAGNYWRHGLHPDMDPVWPTGDETTAEINSGAKRLCPNCKKPLHVRNGSCQSCGHVVRKPWVCPSCSQSIAPWQKVENGCCPNCGVKIQKPVRRIVMEDGRMKTESVETAKKRQKSKEKNDVQVWFACLYPCVYKRLPLNLARKWYKERTGKWPQNGYLPKCPEPSSSDWRRSAREVFPELVKR